MKSVNQFVELMFMDPEAPPGPINARGNEIRRGFMSSERYVIDFADDFTAEGWEQFDTDQDACYFGVWINKKRLQTLTYAEGDWTLVTCPDWQHYKAEIEDAIRFYGEGFIAKTIETEPSGYVNADGKRECRIVEYRQDRTKFLEPPKETV